MLASRLCAELSLSQITPIICQFPEEFLRHWMSTTIQNSTKLCGNKEAYHTICRSLLDLKFFSKSGSTISPKCYFNSLVPAALWVYIFNYVGFRDRCKRCFVFCFFRLACCMHSKTKCGCYVNSWRCCRFVSETLGGASSLWKRLLVNQADLASSWTNDCLFQRLRRLCPDMITTITILSIPACQAVKMLRYAQDQKAPIRELYLTTSSSYVSLGELFLLPFVGLTHLGFSNSVEINTTAEIRELFFSLPDLIDLAWHHRSPFLQPWHCPRRVRRLHVDLDRSCVIKFPIIEKDSELQELCLNGTTFYDHADEVLSAMTVMMVSTMTSLFRLHLDFTYGGGHPLFKSTKCILLPSTLQYLRLSNVDPYLNDTDKNKFTFLLPLVSLRGLELLDCQRVISLFSFFVCLWSCFIFLMFRWTMTALIPLQILCKVLAYKRSSSQSIVE